MKETTKINHNYIYEDYDMWAILNLRLQQENLNNVFIIPPISTLESNQLQIQLQEEQNRNHATPNRTLLIPYNLGNYHWVGIVIQVENNRATKFTYYDSILADGENSEYYSAISNTFKSVYGIEISENLGFGLRQRDNTSCGPLTIENLINAALHYIISGFPNVFDIRTQHVYLMNTFSPEHYFNFRQMHNFPSFKFNQQYNPTPQNQPPNHHVGI